jgi:GNAT superfamily N-acetyltransferase
MGNRRTIRIQAAMSGQDPAHLDDAQAVLPKAPSEVPIPQGTIRLFHYTRSMDSARSVLKEGLREALARGDDGLGDPASSGIWASSQYPGDGKPVFEFWVRPEQISRRAQSWPNGADVKQWVEDQEPHSLIMAEDIPAAQIVALHLPWHHTARYLIENDAKDQSPWLFTEEELNEWRKRSDWSDGVGILWYAANYVKPEGQKQASLLKRSSLKGIIQKYEEQGAELYVVDSPGYWTLSKIVLPEDIRGAGLGTQIMTELCSLADQADVAIFATPDTTFGASSKARLQGFYRRFGFIPNAGRYKDFRSRETMVRQPRTRTKQGFRHPDEDAQYVEESAGWAAYPDKREGNEQASPMSKLIQEKALG